MNISLTPTEQAQLRQWQKQRRANDGYVKVTVMLMLDAGWPAAMVAETLGLDATTVYGYARAFATLGLAKYLAPRAARLLGPTDQCPVGARVSGSQYAALYGLPSAARLAAAHVSGVIFPLRPNGLIKVVQLPWTV